MSEILNSLSIIDTVDTSTVTQTLQKISQFQALVQSALRSGQDYDIIPGTQKPTLLKPGAEKITMLMGVNPEYEFIEKIEDYKSEFFSYNIRCTLFRNGNPVAQGLGSCNSKEKKYRYINVLEKDIPKHIDISTIESFQDNYGNTKYRIENPDICSLVNTILKMAKKRAFIDATLQLAALSEVFTQDLEDMKDMLKDEQLETMDLKAAAAIKITFGKHKGQSLGDTYKNYPDYINWLADNAKDNVMKKACRMLIDAAEEAREQKVKERLKNAQNNEETLKPNDFEGTPLEIKEG